MILGLFPELLAVGGVQTAGRHTAAVLGGAAEQHGVLYRFLSLNDPEGEHEIRVGELSFSFRGFHRAKTSFITTALRLASQQPHVILAAHPNLAVPAAAMRVLTPGARVVVMSHGIEVWKPLGALCRHALRGANYVLAPSRDTAGKLSTVQGVSEEKIRCVAWGLDPEFAALCERPDLRAVPQGFPKGRVILTVGRWLVRERYKGIDHLIQAMPELLGVVPELKLVAVGDGDDRPRLEKLAADLGLERHVHFLGSPPIAELAGCYARADVFALPSGGEGFGLVFLEAMALGKPVVGGAQGGTPDVVQDGVTGILVPYGDIGSLARALETLLTDDQLRRQMGECSRERVRVLYRFETFRNRLMEVLEESALVSG
jgi:phosphatidylinositol alpha-1,6-mannosyltransferase